MSAFILLVAHYIQQEIQGAQYDHSGCRLILPYRIMDVRPDGADDSTRVDIGLKSCSIRRQIKLQPNPSYAGMFCVIEVKPKFSTKDLDDACIQLFDYSRNIYANQHDRRFVWGLTCCRNMVNAFIISNYKGYSSLAMDVTTSSGRHEFIRLLVGWSMCRKRQLGNDETIQWHKKLNCYEIRVPLNNSSNESVSYYSSEIIMSADRLFGRHCRCFLASPVKPQTLVSVDDRIQPSVVVKDSWAIYNTAPKKDDATDLEAKVNGLYIDDDNNSAFAWPSANPSLNTCVRFDEMRNEICTLSRINKALGVNPQLDGLYPKLLCGGWVCQPTDTGQTLDSTGDIMFALNREQQDKTPFCLHVRYAMEPIGHPLKYLKSASELVVVLYDAMRCHKAINDSCNILHRDISDNNILVVRNDDHIHGLLIDFDCAVDRSAERQHVRPERTGTLPFMSIGNLENSTVQRTMLDDWESLLYLVCWFGTFGVNGNCNDINCKHRINMWCVGDEDEIAALKRSDLNSIENFEDSITRDFGKHDSNGADGERLKKLAMHLYQTMFFNPRFGAAPGCPYHGTRKYRKYDLSFLLEDDEIENSENGEYDSDSISTPSNLINSEQDSLSSADPFERRVEKEQLISQDLLKILEYHAKIARRELLGSK